MCGGGPSMARQFATRFQSFNSGLDQWQFPNASIPTPALASGVPTTRSKPDKLRFAPNAVRPSPPTLCARPADTTWDA